MAGVGAFDMQAGCLRGYVAKHNEIFHVLSCPI